MPEQYSESLVMRKIAESIGTYVKAISDKLSYAKGHRGTIVADKSDYYIVEINGVEHKLRSKWPFVVGQSVIVFALQNNMNDLIVIPAYKAICSEIKRITNEALQSAPFDKTYDGIIASVNQGEEEGECVYEVIIGQETVTITSDIVFSVGDLVNVLVPKNDWEAAKLMRQSGGGGGGSVWGEITGTLTDQTDLKNALNEASGSATWGQITGSIASQTDLQNIFNEYYSWLLGLSDVVNDLDDHVYAKDSGVPRGNILMATSAGSSWVPNISNGVSFLTVAPTEDNTDDLKIVFLSTDPANKYMGYIYVIGSSGSITSVYVEKTKIYPGGGSGGSVWGQVTGNIDNQTDLKAKFDPLEAFASNVAEHIVNPGWNDGEVLTGSSAGPLWLENLAKGLKYTTTAPTANNDGSFKLVVLSGDPVTKYYGYIYICYVNDGFKIYVNKTQIYPDAPNYMTIELDPDGDVDYSYVKFLVASGAPTNWENNVVLQYGYNSYSDMTPNIWRNVPLTRDSGGWFPIAKGYKYRIKGSNPDGFMGHLTFMADAPVKISGNIMSLIDPTSKRIDVPDMGFAHLFQNSPIITAPELPAEIVRYGGYLSMFNDCDLLDDAPALPAQFLGPWAYNFMFAGCTSLTGIPALKALDVPFGGYYHMFEGCTNIKMSTTKTGTYDKNYQLPAQSARGDAASWAFVDMFNLTGGTFTGTPTFNTTYYTSNKIIYA